ncbi:MAG: HD domain-containing protein [Clostridiales bacterium]|nr:HD domain-containing protein [Clostridiales bacterium]
MSADFSTEKTFTYLKGYAMGAGMQETVSALSYARQKHNGQMRKSGEPYISHPLIMASHAVSLGITDDATVAAILLHDVTEDCGVEIDTLPFSDDVRTIVSLLTFKHQDENDKETEKAVYYDEISTDVRASICKLIDRCHNVSSMAGTFTEQKLLSYIDETTRYVLPMLRKTKDMHPEYGDILFVLKYHIHSVIDSIKATMEPYVKSS